VGQPFADAGVRTPAHRIGKGGRRVSRAYVGTVSMQPGEAEKILAAAKRERRTVSACVAKCSNGSHHERGEIARAGGGLISTVGLAIQLHYHPRPQSLTLLSAGRLRSRKR